MTEWGNENAETTEQIGGKLMEFIEQAEFGSPAYQAASDYLFLRQSEKSLQLLQRNVNSKEEELEGKTYWKVKARIAEQKIALLELSIYQNQSRVKGYDSAFTQMGIGFEHSLISAAHKEAEHLFPVNPGQQRNYVSGLSETFFERAQDIINSKRE